MRFESKVTSISWIPSEAIAGMMKLPFEMGVSRYDEPPPETIDDLEALRLGDRFRFANVLRGWIEVEDGRIVGHGQDGGGQIGNTTMRLGSWPCNVVQGTIAQKLYGSTRVTERHRHRYEVNNDFREKLNEHGMVISGVSPDYRTEVRPGSRSNLCSGLPAVIRRPPAAPLSVCLSSAARSGRTGRSDRTCRR